MSGSAENQNLHSSSHFVIVLFSIKLLYFVACVVLPCFNCTIFFCFFFYYTVTFTVSLKKRDKYPLNLLVSWILLNVHARNAKKERKTVS